MNRDLWCNKINKLKAYSAIIANRLVASQASDGKV